MRTTSTGMRWSPTNGGSTSTRIRVPEAEAGSAGREAAPGRTLNQWLDDWLDLCRRRGLRASTIESYRTMLRLHVTEELGKISLESLTRRDLDAVYARLLDNGRRDGSGGLSPRTVRYLHTILNKALADAVRADLLSVNPAAATDPPSPRAAKARVFPVWSPAELARFLASVRDEPLYPIFHLAATTGLRRGELLGLRWCDLNVEAGELHVVQAMVEVGHVPQITPPKSERSRRLVALDTETVAVLRRHRAAVNARGGSVSAEHLVFTGRGGGPLHPSLLSYYFRNRVERSGVRPIRFHDLRHTHATHALQAGIHPKIVSERLGHSSVTITLDIYSHLLPGMQREAAEAVAALMRQ